MGDFISENPIDPHVENFLKELQMLQKSKTYTAYWKEAKEKTSCYPSALSFATMKAGTSSGLIS
jgi:hypothetical protein